KHASRDKAGLCDLWDRCRTRQCRIEPHSITALPRPDPESPTAERLSYRGPARGLAAGRTVYPPDPRPERQLSRIRPNRLVCQQQHLIIRCVAIAQDTAKVLRPAILIHPQPEREGCQTDKWIAVT